MRDVFESDETGWSPALLVQQDGTPPVVVHLDPVTSVPWIGNVAERLEWRLELKSDKLSEGLRQFADVVQRFEEGIELEDGA
jgi:hypothetical protein